MKKVRNGCIQKTGLFKRMTQISGAVLRLTVGIGGAALVFLALKDKVKRNTSGSLKPKA